jgi:dolichyl-phosphate beta-glucosyltransferase
MPQHIMRASTVIVVPCFNEARRLVGERFLEFARRHADIRLLMVDDGSSDGTRRLLEELSARSAGRIGVQSLPKNQGKAEAVRQGVLTALEDGTEAVGYWDADLATPLEDIPRFRQVLSDHGDVQLVLGARMPLLGRQIHRSLWRGRLGRLFASAASVALRLRIFDTQCGAKLFRVTTATAEIFSEPFLARWIFDVELMARLLRANRDHQPEELLYEFPLERWEEVAGSQLKLRDFVKAPWELAAITWKYRRAAGRVASKPIVLSAGNSRRAA